MEVRDGTLANLATQLNTLASLLISEVNAIHAAGFSPTGSTGANFFTGTDARSIAVNTALLNDPALVQTSGVSGAVGDNQVILALAQLAQKSHAGLGNQTFAQHYNQSVATLGQALASANGRLADEQVVHSMLTQQRAAVSGVSVDEEMTNLMTYQRAFEASARVMSVVDGLLETLINIKR
jgi:flagellar hook-associated protein 1 FlgK